MAVRSAVDQALERAVRAGEVPGVVALAAVLAELSSRYPEQGGIYAWARRAFGQAHGFICGWCMWVNNLFYFPSLLLFAAANLLIPISAPELADNRVVGDEHVVERRRQPADQHGAPGSGRRPHRDSGPRFVTVTKCHGSGPSISSIRVVQRTVCSI